MSHTNFSLSFCEWALRLPTFFPISGLARHGVKPRLCRSSWRAFTSTHPLMLPSTSPREALLACPPFPFWNLLSITVKATLSFPCSRSDPLFLAKMRLSPTLTLSHLTIWYSGQTALFLFLLTMAALAFLPTALSVALRPLFPSQQAQYAQVFLLKPVPLSKLFADLGSINKSAAFLFFSFYLTLVLSSSLCPLRLSCYLNLSGRNCLLSPPVLSGYNGPLDTCFVWETMQLMSWPDGEHYLCPPQFLVVFFHLFLVSTHHFSLTGGVLSHQNSLTHRFPGFPSRNLCSLITLAMCFFAFASTAYC